MASLADVQDGLEGVLAFATEIAEPDRDGGSLRYRGIDVEQLVGTLPFEAVWGLLVDDQPERPLGPTGQTVALPLHTGDTRVDLQAAVAALAPAWGLAPLVDTSVARREHSSRASRRRRSTSSPSRRAAADLPPVPERRCGTRGQHLAERFLLRWRGRSTRRGRRRSTRTGSPRPSTA